MGSFFPFQGDSTVTFTVVASGDEAVPEGEVKQASLQGVSPRVARAAQVLLGR